MNSEFGFAWSKLYLGVLAMATSDAPMPKRVENAYRMHIKFLNSSNLSSSCFERLQHIKEKLARVPGTLQHDDEDSTLDVKTLNTRQAELIAEEIVSLFDEVAKIRAVADARATLR